MSQPLAAGSISQTVSPVKTPSSSNIERIFDTALESYKKKTKKDLKKQTSSNNWKNAILPAPFWPRFKRISLAHLALANVVSLVFSPAQVVFSGVDILLLAAKDVAASQGFLIDLFGRIEGFFRRLEIYTGVPLTPAMTEKMVEITVEVLDILATATKEMKQSRAKKFVKRVAGLTELEDGLKKLDKLTNEESVLASAQLLK
ncbi:hypothetical protein EI94DRAFT_1705219 [Lactarius quietus]|nr:hypothetical protein EI94DRAFT_1705219 [Lactarius quietus]